MAKPGESCRGLGAENLANRDDPDRLVAQLTKLGWDVTPTPPTNYPSIAPGFVGHLTGR